MNPNLKHWNDYYNLLNDTLRDSYHQVIKIYDKIPRAHVENLYINIRTGSLMMKHLFNSDYYYSSRADIPICWHFSSGGKASFEVIRRLFKTYYRWIENYAQNQSVDILKLLIQTELEKTNELIQYLKYDNSERKSYKTFDEDSDHSSFVQEQELFGYWQNAKEDSIEDDDDNYDNSDDLKDFIVEGKEEEDEEEEEEEEGENEEEEEEDEEGEEEGGKIKENNNEEEKDKNQIIDNNDEDKLKNELNDSDSVIDINNCDGIVLQFGLVIKPNKPKKLLSKRKRSTSTISISPRNKKQNPYQKSTNKKQRIISDDC